MEQCPLKSEHCIRCPMHFQQLRPLVREVIVPHHFIKDAPDFDTNMVIDCRHENFTSLHKFEEVIEGNHIFRALHKHLHMVYAIDKNHRLIFLRAFHNFDLYKKFLNEKREIVHMINRL